MLPQRHRLKKEKDFASVLKEKRRTEEAGMFLKARENGLQEVRFGIVVSKQVAKKAVDRNRIHRKLSQAVWQLLDQIQGGIDVVIITTVDIKSLSLKETEEALLKLLKRRGFLN